MSFVSASSAVHVHASPTPSGADFASPKFFCFAYVNAQDLVNLDAV